MKPAAVPRFASISVAIEVIEPSSVCALALFETRREKALQAFFNALYPTELRGRRSGRDRTRTCDLALGMR
jgi:hypothetical protein